ncbi:zinc finger protein [Artemisia annua]|uniref:Zinc finger protein n=1 Tax=Artemisia annua TaxID=35608 RepID=A0A2U1PNU3_ARTAN|nr:zinc finger protein [Artemisia annua]
MEGQSSHASVNPNISASANTSSDAGTGLKSASGDIAWEWGVLKDPIKRGMVWCTLCDKRMSGGITRLKQYLTHTKGDVTGCTKSVGTSNVRGPLDSILKSDHQKTSQTTLDKNNPIKQKLKMVAWKKIATWAYAVGLPFNAVRDESFQDMINAIGDYGRSGCFLNPAVFYRENANLETNGELTTSLYVVINKLVPDPEENDTVRAELNRDVDENDEWTVPTETELQDFVDACDGLLWSDVREAMGGNENIGPSTRSKRERYRDDDDEISIEEDDLGLGGNLDKEVNALDDVDSDAEPVDCN